MTNVQLVFLQFSKHYTFYCLHNDLFCTFCSFAVHNEYNFKQDRHKIKYFLQEYHNPLHGILLTIIKLNLNKMKFKYYYYHVKLNIGRFCDLGYCLIQPTSSKFRKRKEFVYVVITFSCANLID